MGSGKKRKPADIVIITPKEKIVKGRGGSLSSGKKISANDISSCPSSFRVNLPSGLHMEEGVRLIVKRDRNTVVFYSGDTEITRLNAKKGQKIAFCISKGFLYKGIIKRKGKTIYAEIIRAD